MRKTLAAALILVWLALLTGCVRYKNVATINGSGTVSGSVVVGYTQELIKLGKQMNGPDSDPLAELKATLDANVASLSSGSATVRPYQADAFTGFETTFTDVSAADFIKLLRHKEGNPGAVYTLERHGDTYAFSAELDSPREGQMELPAEAFKDVDLSFSLTFPGPVTSSNGEVSGNTVTWRPTLPHPPKLVAEGQAAGSANQPANPAPGSPAPAANAPGGDGGTNPAIFIGGAAVLLAAGGAIAYGLRHRAGR